MIEVKNERLGNFGFLLDFNQDFLFEFAQLAESNLYVNKRLCAVYIRQLTESFFDAVIDREKIEIDKKSLSDGVDRIASIHDKQRAIGEYFHDSRYRRPKYGKKAFPKYPGSDNIKYSRLECPQGEGDNRRNRVLVDPSRKTLYVWDFIRRLGNAGAHAVLTDDNKRWLQEKYIIAALEQLCFRMSSYFYGADNKENKVTYNLEKYSLASREIYYPEKGSKTVVVKQQGILPSYLEKKYYTVMPKPDMRGGKVFWKNYINKYSIIRRYEITANDSVRDYLLQSQKAYLILQQTGNLEGIAPYAVLADLRNSTDYYVTSYEFDSEPYDLCIETLRECGILTHRSKLLILQQKFIEIMINLSKNHIYQRNLTHNSIKICKVDDGNFEIKMIDFELVKLYEPKNDIAQATVFMFANEQNQRMKESAELAKYDPYGNIRQYGSVEWDENTTELEYQKEQRRRAGMILCNMLCPNHFDSSKSFHTIASLEEICEQENIILTIIDREILEKLYHTADALINDDTFTLIKANEMIRGLLNEYKSC